MRVRLDVAYDGTNFHGWAKQNPQLQLRTVQGELEQILELIVREPVEITVAGRTDAGVHASGQVCHIDLPESFLATRSMAGDPANLVRRMSRLLPEDVRVTAAAVAPETFDARFSALRRHYVYRVTTAPFGALPTRVCDTAVWPRSIDLERVQQAADAFLGLNDFAAVSKYKPNATTVRDLQRFQWFDVSTPAEPNLYEAHVSADAFCWNMVRGLVGTCLVIGDGRREVAWVQQLLQERERNSSVPVAPARGLSLVGVDYPEDPAEFAARAEQTRARRESTGGAATQE